MNEVRAYGRYVTRNDPGRASGYTRKYQPRRRTPSSRQPEAAD